MPSTKKSWIRRILWMGAAGLLIGGAIAWYLFTLKFDDTRSVKADFTVEALSFIREFEKDNAAANQKYSEKIIAVNGKVSAIEKADTTYNVKMINDSTGSYISFGFQANDANKVKDLKAGDAVTIKGSCSAGVYSSILESEFITFKRCILE